MSDFPEELKVCTKQFALRIIRVVQALGNDNISFVLGKQLLRCGTSVGANYRAACHARSPAEFRAKLGIVEEECDETIYWMELITEAGLLTEERLADLKKEAGEILSIVITSINTSKRNTRTK